MNAYLNQLNNMSNTLRTGIGAIARDRLNKQALGLEEAKTDYTLAQNQREWDLKAPGLQLERDKAKSELGRLNAPVGLNDLAPTERAKLHFVWQPEDKPAPILETKGPEGQPLGPAPVAQGQAPFGQVQPVSTTQGPAPLAPAQPDQKRPPMLINKVEDLYGAKLDMNEGSPTKGTLIKADGTPLTRREFEAKRQQYNQLLAANTSAYKLVQDRGDALEDEIEQLQGQIDSGTGNKAQLQQALATKQTQLQKVQQWQNDPQLQLATLREQYDNLMAWGDPEALKGAERVAGQMEKLQARVDAQRPEWSEPKEAVVNGQRVMVQYDKRSGQPRIVPGVQPAQDASWSQPFEATNSAGAPVLLRQNTKTGELQLVKGFGPKPPKGMRVEVDGAGGVTMVTNADQSIGNSALTKPNVNKQQDVLLGLQDQAARLTEIERMYDPAFLTAEGRFKDAILTGKDLLNMEMDPEEREFYAKRNEFMTGAYRQINQYIKDITGAALSEKEATRIMAGAPNPKDPPQRYAAKLKATLRDVKMGMVRTRYALSRGLSLEDVSIDSMPAIIDRRGDELEQQFLQQNPKASPQQINMQVQQQLKSEFGMEI